MNRIYQRRANAVRPYIICLTLLLPIIGLKPIYTYAQVSLPNNVEKVGEYKGIEEYQLKSNKLQVLLARNPIAPVVSVMSLYKVGSRNETAGNTGSVALIERLASKETGLFNRQKGNEIRRLMSLIGANSASMTSNDSLMFLETIPSNRLELAMQIHSDRLRNALITEETLKNEIEAVHNLIEARQRDPFWLLLNESFGTAFRVHPYHNPTIGLEVDVDSMNAARLKQFYDTYFHPNNATLVLVGDFDAATALQLIDRYFSLIPSSLSPIPQVQVVESPQRGEISFKLKQSVAANWLSLSYRIPEALNADTYALDVAQMVLAEGRSSRLFQALIDKQLATNITTYMNQMKDPSLFQLFITLSPNVKHEAAEEAVLKEIDRLKTQSVSDDELKRAINGIVRRLVLDRDSTQSFALQLRNGVQVGDWKFKIDYLERVQKVAAADLQRVARQYFDRVNLTAGWLTTDLPPPVPAQGVILPETERPTNFAAQTKRLTLKNGTTALVLENHLNPTVSIQGSVRGVGNYFNPPDNPVLAQLTGLMLDKGSQKRSREQLAQDIEAKGINLSLSVSMPVLNFSATALSADITYLLDLLAEILLEPAFPADEFERLKTQYKAQLAQEAGDMERRASVRLSQLAFDPSHPYYLPPLEARLKSLEATTIEDVKKFYDSHYGGNLTLTVVGDVESQKLIDQVSSLFGKWESKGKPQLSQPRATIKNKEVVEELIKASGVAHVDMVAGHSGTLRRTDPDYFAAVIGDDLLGGYNISSRLVRRFREEGLNDNIFSDFWEATMVDGIWSVHLRSDQKNFRKAIESIKDELKKFQSEGIRADELQALKLMLIGSFKVGLSNNSGLARALAETELYGLGLEQLDKYEELINAVTVDQVNQAIRSHLQPDKLIIVAAGDFGE